MSEAVKERFPDVSRETWERLEVFAALLGKWQKTINLVSPATIPDLWSRHIADSLQLLALAPAAVRWVDLGSGAGLPGLVIAAALAGKAGAQVDLVESDQRKCGFLREAVRHMSVPARVRNERIEAALADWREPVDAVTARALAPLPELLELAFPVLKGAIGLFPKGRDVEAELTEARRIWHIDAELAPSLTSPDGRIVIVRAVSTL